MEANSGVVFPQMLALKFTPTTTPVVQGFGWNLGNHYHHPRSEKSITWIVTRDEWLSLFAVYVREIHCLYGFVNTENVLLISSKRWADPSATNANDHVLCGVAALAMIFSSERRHNREKLLADCAKDILDSTSTLRDPTEHDAEAWLLRTLYLRFNSPPHAAWMASCTTLHIIEAAGIHKEPTETSLVYPRSEAAGQDLERRRRLFWLAKLLNTWISFEYGRSRVVLQDSLSILPQPVEGDYTMDLIGMFQISEVLDPSRSSEPQELERCLLQVASFHFTLVPLILSQSNLCFTLYRRLRLATVNVRKVLLDQIVEVGCKGLEASIRATQTSSPWWHVSNVPFQFVCILLAMDTQESLCLVSRAISTLKSVVNHFRTAMAQQALATVERLVRIAQSRKEQDARALQSTLIISVPDNHAGLLLGDNVPLEGCDDTLLEQWSSDLLWNTPALGEVDWDQFGTETFDFSADTMSLT